jgi:hypothetical protein
MHDIAMFLGLFAVAMTLACVVIVLLASRDDE